MPRPCKAHVTRFPCGRIREERPEVVRSVALAARVKHHGARDIVLEKRKIKSTDPMWGYALGRLRLTEAITREQHDAGVRFIGLYVRNARLRGWPNPNLRSSSTVMVAAGHDCAPEPDADTILQARRAWEDAYRAIYDAERDCGPLFEALKYVCIEDRDSAPEKLGNLRIALNALSKLWR